MALNMQNDGNRYGPAWIAVCLITLVTGCAASSRDVPPTTAMPEASVGMQTETFYRQPAASEGSLWTDSGELLFVDLSARRVGDTVTVDIVENTSSNMDVNTEATRTSGIKAGIPHMLGYMEKLGSRSTHFDPENMIEANIENQFKGEGTSDRSGGITASIGARVTEVLPNGNLVIFGRREMQVNNEIQFITVAGIARPEDIGPDNRVKSTYLADGRIEYSGKGVLSDKQRPGWMSRAIDHVWPF